MVASEIVGPYRLIEGVGAGGDGIVFRAEDVRTGGLVALKIARSARRGDIDVLKREVRALERLNSARVLGVVSVADSELNGSTPWFAMEWIDGITLGTFMRDLSGIGTGVMSGKDTAQHISQTIDLLMHEAPGAGSVASRTALESAHTGVGRGVGSWSEHQRQVLRVLAAIGSVLAKIHALGLVHGDLSPSNILLRTSGEPVLLDFGTTPIQFEPGLLREAAHGWIPGRGTPGFAAPEVLMGEVPDARCDIYGFGCIAHELLTGHRPFVASRTEELVRQHLHAPLVDPGELRPELPPALGQLLVRMLEKDPARRIAHMQVIVEELRAHLGEAPRPMEVSAGTGLLRPRTYGRESELRVLREAVERARTGQGAFILLHGGAGTGKTRLLNEVALSASRAGMKVVTLRDHPVHDGATERAHGGPLAFLSPLFQHAADMSAEGQFSGLAAGDSRLAFVTSVLEPYSTDLNTDAGVSIPKLGPEMARQRVLDALGVLLKLVAAPAGLVLLCDDLQHGNALWRDFIVQRAEQLREARILIVAALQINASREAWQPLLAAASVERAVLPLSRSAVRDVTRETLGVRDVPDALVDWVYQHSEGNPYFAVEYLSQLVASGRVSLRLGVSSCEASVAAGGHAAVPTSLDALLSARFEALSADAHETCVCAAVLGREFEATGLREFLPTAAHGATALQELVSAQILEVLSDGRYRFVHEKLRDIAQSHLDPARHRALHVQRAMQLELRGPSTLQELAAAGYHFSKASEPGKAVAYLVRAARAAAAGYDLESAAELYRAGVEQCLMLGSEGGTRGSEIHEELGDVQVMLARHGDARECYVRAFDGAGDGVRLARLHRKLAKSYWTLHEYEAATSALARAEQHLGARDREGEPAWWDERIEIGLNRGEWLYFSRAPAEQLSQLLDELRPAVEQYGTGAQRTAFYQTCAAHRQSSGRFAYDVEAVELSRRALEASVELPLELQADAKFLHAFALIFGTQVERERALPYLEAAARDAEEIGASTLLSRVRTYHTIALLRLGRLEAARSAAKASLASAEAARLPPYVAAAKASLGWVSWKVGRDEEARALSNEAREIWFAHPHPFPFRWIALLPLLSLAHAEDDFERAAQLLEELLDEKQQILDAEVQDTLALARAACQQGTPRDAARALARALAAARTHHYC